MSNKTKRAFRTTKIKIDQTTVPDADSRNLLETLFITMEAAKTDAVAKERVAMIAAAKAKAQNAAAQIAETEFLQKASDHFNQVAGDRLWIVYRGTDNTIVLEGFTERLIRNNMRAQQQLLGNQVTGEDSSEIDRSGLYEADEEDDEEDSKE